MENLLVAAGIDIVKALCRDPDIQKGFKELFSKEKVTPEDFDNFKKQVSEDSYEKIVTNTKL